MENWLLILFLFFRSGEPSHIQHLATYLDRESCVEAIIEAREMEHAKMAWFACVPSKVAAPKEK